MYFFDNIQLNNPAPCRYARDAADIESIWSQCQTMTAQSELGRFTSIDHLDLFHSLHGSQFNYKI